MLQLKLADNPAAADKSTTAGGDHGAFHRPAAEYIHGLAGGDGLGRNSAPQRAAVEPHPGRCRQCRAGNKDRLRISIVDFILFGNFVSGIQYHFDLVLSCRELGEAAVVIGTAPGIDGGNGKIRDLAAVHVNGGGLRPRIDRSGVGNGKGQGDIAVIQQCCIAVCTAQHKGGQQRQIRTVCKSLIFNGEIEITVGLQQAVRRSVFRQRIFCGNRPQDGIALPDGDLFAGEIFSVGKGVLPRGGIRLYGNGIRPEGGS